MKEVSLTCKCASEVGPRLCARADQIFVPFDTISSMTLLSFGSKYNRYPIESKKSRNNIFCLIVNPQSQCETIYIN
jgi:hypothetical protein